MVVGQVPHARQAAHLRPGGSLAGLKEAGAGGLPDSDKLLCKGPLSDPVP